MEADQYFVKQVVWADQLLTQACLHCSTSPDRASGSLKSCYLWRRRWSPSVGAATALWERLRKKPWQPLRAWDTRQSPGAHLKSKALRFPFSFTFWLFFPSASPQSLLQCCEVQKAWSCIPSLGATRPIFKMTEYCFDKTCPSWSASKLYPWLWSYRSYYLAFNSSQLHCLGSFPAWAWIAELSLLNLAGNKLKESLHAEWPWLFNRSDKQCEPYQTPTNAQMASWQEAVIEESADFCCKTIWTELSFNMLSF